MSLPRFFLENQVLSRQSEHAFVLDLSEEDMKHARVLRLAPKEHIAVIDAEQDFFECVIEDVAEGKLLVSISRHEHAPLLGPRITLLQGLAKGDKVDTVIRQATELGVSSFLPLVCERSVVRLDAKREERRLRRWQSIAKSAAMQSGQPRIPSVSAPCSVQEALPCLHGQTALLVFWEEAPASEKIHHALARALAATGTAARDSSIAIVVGPEGGLTDQEVEALLGSNPHACLVSLGDAILRTETAGVVAPALVLYELGCLGGAEVDCG